MTERERFHETMSWGNPDRPPYRELAPWPETIDRWYTEGYPKRADFKTYFGFDRYDPVGLDEEIHPVFREEVLEETDEGIIKSSVRSREFQGMIVKSIGKRWSAGAYGSVNSSVFENTKLSLNFAPAVEYNVFPYRRATSTTTLSKC